MLRLRVQHLALLVILEAYLICSSAYSGPTAQSLTWDFRKTKSAEKTTLVYGEVEVLASGTTIYFCPAQFAGWPGGDKTVGDGGGYCGIQELRDGDRSTIFSQWCRRLSDRPLVVKKSAETVLYKFDNEGSGKGTKRSYEWEISTPFRFLLQRTVEGKNAYTSFYFYNEELKKWELQARIASPHDDQAALKYLWVWAAFLENFTGEDPTTPKVCLYRLWGGTSPENLEFFRYATGQSSGNGHWGILNGCYYLAEGDDAKLNPVFAQFPLGARMLKLANKQQVQPISDRPLPPQIVTELDALLEAAPASVPTETAADAAEAQAIKQPRLPKPRMGGHTR